MVRGGLMLFEWILRPSNCRFLAIGLSRSSMSLEFNGSRGVAYPLIVLVEESESSEGSWSLAAIFYVVWHLLSVQNPCL